MIGRTLNQYRIVAQLGKGGMGEVYVAEDSRLDRKIALKVLPEEVAADAERRARFEREAKAIAALTHPNIVTIHSVEQAEGVHFITMELVQGKTLTELIPRHGLPLNKFLEWSIPLADAIGAAHQQGVVHRDLKPDNVMIDEHGRPRVLDFGLAKLKDESTSADDTRLPTATVTQEGKVLGTVAYMSPEQTEGKPIDQRSDIFSLGVVLYQMATGQRPFKGDSSASLISSILRDNPPSVTDLNQGLPRHLGRVIRVSLHKDPERRYQTAKDLRNELTELKEEVDSGAALSASLAANVGRPRRSRLAIGLAAAVVTLAVLAVATYRFTGRRQATPEGPAPFHEMRITRVTSSGQSTAAAVSADGKYVAHVVDDGATASLWMTQVPTASAVQIVPPRAARMRSVVFSPSGDFIYYLQRESFSGAINYQELFRIPVLGGASTKVLADVDSRPAFSPDGRQFVFRRGTLDGQTQITVADTDGTEERILASRKGSDSYGELAWSPDGTMIAALALDLSRHRMTVVALPAEGGAERPISATSWPVALQAGTTAANLNLQLTWLPDGQGLVLAAPVHDLDTSAQLWFVPYPSGPSRRITNDLNAYLTVDLTTDGRTLVTVQRETTYNIWAQEGDSSPIQITSGVRTDDAFGIAWTPDGRIVHGSSSPTGVDLWVRDGDGGNARQLTRDARLNVRPAVSPDGRHIYFVSNRTGEFAIWRIDLDGGNPTQVTEGSVGNQISVSPDGQWLVYDREEASMSRTLWRLPVDGGPEEKISEELGLVQAGFSPDGSRLAFGFSIWTGKAIQGQTAVIPFEPAAEPEQVFPINVSGGGGSLSWSPDGRALTYVESSEGISHIWSQPVDGAERRLLARFDATGGVRQIAWSPDGKILLFDRGKVTSDVVLLEGFR